MADSNYNILSCDGGGMRGFSTALLIKKLDDELGILQKVDLFAGTSTGGIIAVLLASGLDMKSVVEIYIKQGKRIFTPYSPSLISTLLNIPRNLFETFIGEKLPHLSQVMYDSNGLKQVLRETPFLSNNPTLRELKRKVVVTTFQLYDPDSQRWRTAALHNLGDPNTASARTKRTHEIPAIDAVLSTSAAPFYFPPHFVEGFGYCVDGGVFANNPCMAAVATMDRYKIAPLKNVKILSIGTGDNQEGIPDEQVKNPLTWGMLKWTNPLSKKSVPPIPLFEVLLDGGTEQATRVSNILLGEERFCRADATLIESVALDDYAKIKVMEKSVEKYAETQEWQKIKEWIKTHW
jgi:hypothetical protein